MCVFSGQDVNPDEVQASSNRNPHFVAPNTPALGGGGGGRGGGGYDCSVSHCCHRCAEHISHGDTIIADPEQKDI